MNLVILPNYIIGLEQINLLSALLHWKEKLNIHNASSSTESKSHRSCFITAVN